MVKVRVRDVEEMAAVIREVWNDAELRRDLSQQGLAQAAKFSWTRAARETLRVYESVGVVVP